MGINSARAQLISLTSERDFPPLHSQVFYDRMKRESPALEQAIDSLLDSYNRWKPPEAQPEALHIFAPSLHRGAQITNTERNNDARAKNGPSHYQRWLVEILHLSLFVDRIWIPDPAEIVARAVQEIVRPQISIHQFLSDPLEAYYAMRALVSLEPLVQAGVVCYYPPLRLYETTVSTRLFGHYRDFSEAELSGAWPNLFVTEGMVYADALEASYAALSRPEFDTLGRSARELGQSAGLLDARLVAALPHMKLPYFENVTPELLVSVRRNEQSFEDFRDLLREAARALPGGAESSQFVREVSRIEQQILSPAVKKLLGEVRGITRIKDCLSEAGIDFIAGSLAGFTISGGEMLAAMPSGAVTALSKVLVKLLAKRPNKRPASNVVLAFHTGRMPDSGFLEPTRASWWGLRRS
ncbi:MAG: hypothetical protein QOJ45_1757 [Verrucomicrobiota bacterium]|jgi:hypothetical protein